MIQQVFNLDPNWSKLPLIKRHTGGLVFFISIVFLVVTLFYSTMSWMWDEQRLPLSKVIIQGDLTYVEPSDVQSALAHLPHLGTFMSQDVGELQQAIESIPWVERASIRKQWPDTIKVFLTEHQVAAIWNGNALLDERGVVFDGDIALLSRDYVKLYGPQNTGPEMLTIWQAYSPMLKELGLTISSLVLNERHAWQIILDNGIRLELGKESLDERIKRFLYLYRFFGSKVEQISYIDLRYDTGAAVGWYSDQDVEQEKTDD